MTDANFGTPRPIGTDLPDNQLFLLVDPADAFTAAHARLTSASEAAIAKANQRDKRMVTIPAGVALVVLLYCVLHGYLISGVILAGLVGWGAFWVAIMVGAAIREPARSVGQLAAAGAEEVKLALSGANRGRYQWIGRGTDFVGVFPDAGLAYYFGPATRWRHLILAGRQTIRQVRVNATTQVSQTSTSTTRHSRRFAVAPTRNVAVLSKGKSTTTHATLTSTHTSHVLEIQYQTAPGTSPAWLSVNFAEDGRLAEDWRLMISQIAGLA
ncbi:hypothetical protein SM191_18595 [Sphingomonas sp. 2378]